MAMAESMSRNRYLESSQAALRYTTTLTPAASASFTNECDFQAEPPRSLIPGDMIEAGSWSEVDGMSSGLVSLMAYGKYFMAPFRPEGSPAIPFERWKAMSVNGGRWFRPGLWLVALID